MKGGPVKTSSRTGWILILMFLQACNVIVPSTGVTPTLPVSPPADPTATITASSTPEATITPTPVLTETPDEPTIEVTGISTVVPNPTSWITPTLILLSMEDDSAGWGLTEHEIVRTMDGGKHWANLTPEGGFGEDVNLGGFFMDANTAWVEASTFGSNPSGVLYRTMDGGATWQPVQVPFLTGRGLFFLDQQNGWELDASDCGVGSCGGALYRTADGGETWEVISQIDAQSGDSGGLPLSGHKNGIAFRDQAYGWVGGTQPQDGYVWLFATEDGGKTWHQQDLALPEGLQESFTSVDAPRFFNSQDGILPVSMFYEILSRVFYVTHDGGATWSAGVPAENSGVYDCISTQECWVWDGARLDVTQDGGQTWAMLTPNIDLSQTIMQVDFVSPTTGWVISMKDGGEGELYVTTDGGATWSPLLP